MSNNIQKELVELQSLLFDLSARNPFINVRMNQLFYTEKQSGKSLATLYKQSSFYRKEYGLETTLKVTHFLYWKEPGKSDFYISPFIYKPVKLILDRKLEMKYRCDEDPESTFQINPILIKSFSRFYDVNISDTIQEIDTFLSDFTQQLSTETAKIEIGNSLDNLRNWTVVKCEAIGNFNYKKSTLGVDYETILEQPGLQVPLLLGYTKIDSVKDSQETLNSVVPLDDTQTLAVQKAMNNNVVIQGPPGTGKSHTIVGLISNLLANQKKVLFVSQKRSALQVVYDRMTEIGLGDLCAFFNTQKDEKKEFYNGLKSTWDLLNQEQSEKKDVRLKESEVVQYYLTAYQEYNERLSCSIHDLVSRMASFQNTSGEEVSGVVPKLKEWDRHFDFLSEFEGKVIELKSSTNLSDSFVSKLNKAIFTEKDPLIILEKRIHSLLGTVNDLKSICARYEVKGSLEEVTQLSIAASILNMVNVNQLNLLNTDSKKYKSFGNWAKKYHILKTKADRAKLATQKWKNKPSKAEITELIDLIKHRHAPRGILGILQRKNEKLEKAFSSFDRHLSDVAKIQLLEELREEWNLDSQLEEVEIKLKHNFNIADPINEIDQILNLRNKLGDVSKSTYLTLLEHEQSTELIKEFAELNKAIQQFNHISRFIFDEIPNNEIELLEVSLSELLTDLPNIKLLLPELQKYFMLPLQIRDFVRNNSQKLIDLNGLVMQENLMEVTRIDSRFKQLSADSLEEGLRSDIKSQQAYHELSINNILNSSKKELSKIHDLLSTPASKLTDDQKILKKRLREERKLFIHEVSKQKRHLAVKDFLERSWEITSVAAPVMMMSPLAVSERLQCQEEMFDVVIFDESSQIPLEDAIPAIYRSKRVIVVGDDKQMPPTSFFSSNQESRTLLHQADVVYSREMLKWHYRSEHPALVQFSNSNFYENELLVFPAISNDNPFEFHQVKGVFDAGKNQQEAEEIACYLDQLKDLSQVAVIAFSKEQEETIRKESAKRKIGDELLISNLENVQGIERDIVIISVGYGFNPEGVFRLNFGPINQAQGANRLNVLFTRAKKKVVLFASIIETDFGVTDNMGVLCLRDYIQFVRNMAAADSSQAKIESHGSQTGSAITCDINFKSREIAMKDPATGENQGKDLRTVYSHLSAKFKMVRFFLTIDKLRNPDRFLADSEAFNK